MRFTVVTPATTVTDLTLEEVVRELHCGGPACGIVEVRDLQALMRLQVGGRTSTKYNGRVATVERTR